MEELKDLITDEAKKRHTTILGLSQQMKFSYAAYSQYHAYGYMTICNYRKFQELFPTFRDEEVEKKEDQRKSTIVTPKKLTKREQAFNLAYNILNQHDRTVLPRFYQTRREELLQALKDKGIAAEIFTGFDKELYLRRVE